MIDLYTWPTPNGRKISILLEELKIPYKVHLIDINNPLIIHSAVTFPAPPALTIPILLKPQQTKKFLISGVSPNK